GRVGQAVQWVVRGRAGWSVHDSLLGLARGLRPRRAGGVPAAAAGAGCPAAPRRITVVVPITVGLTVGRTTGSSTVGLTTGSSGPTTNRCTDTATTSAGLRRPSSVSTWSWKRCTPSGRPASTSITGLVVVTGRPRTKVTMAIASRSALAEIGPEVGGDAAAAGVEGAFPVQREALSEA